MNISFFQELLQSISERGRQLLESREPAPGNAQALAGPPGRGGEDG